MLPCRSCHRHVSLNASRCPFCGTSAPSGAVASAPPEFGLLLGLAAAACGPTVDQGGGTDAASSSSGVGDTTSVGTSTTQEATSSTSVDTSTTTSTTGTSTSGSTGTEGTGASSSTGGPLLECDFWANDCGADEKCVPTVQVCPGFYGAFCVGGDWDTTACVVVDEDPVAVGEPCYEDTTGSGFDPCGADSYCVYASPDAVCTPYCQGSADAPVCDDPDTTCALLGGVDLPVCMPACTTDDDCADGATCADGGLGETACIPGVYG